MHISSSFSSWLVPRRGCRGSLLLLLFVALTASTGGAAGLASAAGGEDSTAFLGLARSLEKCAKWSELGVCLRLKAVSLLDRAMRAGPIELTDFLRLEPAEGELATGQREQRALSDSELVAALPPGPPEEREATLDEMLADKLTGFIASRSLRISMPTADLVEGRKKGGGGGGKKGGGMMMMAGLAMGGMMLQMAMAKIALLAGKALLVGKLALLLSVIIALKKLLGGGGGGEAHQVVYATEAHGGGGHGWGRSSSGESNLAAHQLAYSAQARANNAPIASNLAK